MSLCRAASHLERVAVSVHRSVARRSTKPRALLIPDIQRWLHTRPTHHPRDIPRTPSNKLSTIHSRISQALNSLPENPTETAPFSTDEVLQALRTLSVSARPQDLVLIEKILDRLTPLCGLRVDADIHNHILQGLIKNGNVQTLLNWLSQMHEKPGNVRPFLEHWHAFLEYCADNGQPKIIRHAMSKMAHSRRKPNNDTFRLFFRALFNSGAPISEFYSAFDRIENYAFCYDESLADMLFEGFMKLNEPQQAIKVKEEFQRRFSKRVVKSTAIQAEWEESLENEVEKCGMESAIRLCRDFRKEGYKATLHTLTILLRSSRAVADLDNVEEALKMKATPLQWSILIGNAVQAGDLASANLIYRQFKSRGLTPDAPLIQPLVAALCDSAFRGQDDGPIDQALNLYQELSFAASPSSSSSTTTRQFGRQRSSGPDAYMYGTLLRAMANSVDIQKYSSIAVDLLADMESRSIKPDGQVAVASLVIMAMRTSTTFDEALEAYRRVMGNKNPKDVGVKGYRWILYVLSRLSFDHGPAVPPIWHYFEIVKDMRRSGLEISPYVYASLLRRLAKLAEDALEEDTLRLAASVRRVHDHLTLDPSITPDTLLWNQLMDAYQRVGLFAEAYRVWEVLLVSETYDHASVSIVLDTCGYANAWPLAEQVMRKLSERSFMLNRGNWNAYVECMCRNGMLNEAVKAVCLEMGKDQTDAKPNLATARMLLTFAAKTNQQDEVAMRLRRYLPELWESLPADLGGFMIKPELMGTTTVE